MVKDIVNHLADEFSLAYAPFNLIEQPGIPWEQSYPPTPVEHPFNTITVPSNQGLYRSYNGITIYPHKRQDRPGDIGYFPLDFCDVASVDYFEQLEKQRDALLDFCNSRAKIFIGGKYMSEDNIGYLKVREDSNKLIVLAQKQMRELPVRLGLVICFLKDTSYIISACSIVDQKKPSSATPPIHR